MSVLKAFCYTVLLVVLWSITQLLFLLPLKYFLVESPSAFTVGFLGILSSLTAYLSVFFLFDVPRTVEKELFKFKPLTNNTIVILPFLAIGMYLCDRVLWDLFNGLFLEAQAGKNRFNPINYLDIDFLPQLISVFIISPVFEEIFFRKLLFTQLLKKQSYWVSLVISSLCFSLIHIETPHNLLATFFGGLILGTLYYKTKAILYAIITHSLFNIIILFLGPWLAQFYSDFNYNYLYWLSPIIGIVLLYVSLKYITNNK